jgi:hypothetical protein
MKLNSSLDYCNSTGPCGENGWTNVELLSQGIHNQMRGVESVRQIDNFCIVGDSNFWQSRD